TKRSSRTSARRRQIPSWAAISISSSATFVCVDTSETKPFVVGSAHSSWHRTTRSSAPISSRCAKSSNGRTRVFRTARFWNRRLHRPDSKDFGRARLRLRELQGKVLAPPDCGSHARARRAHVRRVRAHPRQRRGGV